MEVYRGIHQANLAPGTILTLGNFDGLHLGHQALLRSMQDLAAQMGREGIVHPRTGLLTFDPHPIAVLRPGHRHLLLTSPRMRLHLAAALGIEIGVIQPFTSETAQIEYDVFVDLLQRHLGMVALVVGPDFALGRNRAGTVDALVRLGRQRDFAVHVMEPVAMDDRPVRSSHIRALLESGDVTTAASLLGRPYRVAGVVEHGDQRGRAVGIPTANVRPPSNKLLPADGVYITRTLLATFDQVHSFPSVTNVGVRPTVNGVHHRVETHILDFPPPGQIDDLYGETVAIEFLTRLRDERRFAGVGELVEQIHADISRTRSWFAVHHHAR